MPRQTDGFPMAFRWLSHGLPTAFRWQVGFPERTPHCFRSCGPSDAPSEGPQDGRSKECVKCSFLEGNRAAACYLAVPPTPILRSLRHLSLASNCQKVRNKRFYSRYRRRRYNRERASQTLGVFQFNYSIWSLPSTLKHNVCSLKFASIKQDLFVDKT